MQNYSLIESCLFLPAFINKKKVNKHFTGKSVLITGASSGIGEQVAYLLAECDCHLILVARRGDRLSQIKEEVAAKAAKVSVFQADLRNVSEIDTFLAFLHKLPGGIDIVINNAGHSIRRSIFESLDRPHDFSRTMAINYFAPVRILLSIIPLLRERQGQIINISTINALLAPVPYFAAYQSSKSAFDVWLRAVSPELISKGIATTSIYLPLVRTAMIQPTAAYKNMPAMSTEHAAKIICKSIYKRKKKYQPWWIVFGQIASIFSRNFADFSKKGEKK
ncbi:SDR family NAD(P)-dependent oxidoreductase [Gracilibacillus oryzae]|uniref:SDR family NAD(P)-dependent oxidoreductase n=1 Tax=Gracilibacillus oryzae TaxID=1672701 RepID=A0A7C8KRD4_9BACI|nr:SDR family NAD(P)-dependent oxidoreductase [Gracilibacillus oryzae]KAB8130107.1 SDR family NAD(P)-dependent oxidoreductase [Gracilibacillus oryzae]